MGTAFKAEGLTFGLSLIALGVLWTLANLGRIDLLATVRTWWPLVLVLWGALELYQALAERASGRSR